MYFFFFFFFFFLLQEIKLSTMRSKPQDEIAENEQEMAAAVINAAKKTLISQVVKRNVIENIVPIVISLKHMVRAASHKAVSGMLQEISSIAGRYIGSGTQSIETDLTCSMSPIV